MYTDGTEKLSRRALQDRIGVSFPQKKPPEGWQVVDNTPPEPTLDELKQRKRSEINNARNETIDAGLDYNGIPVQTRKQDRENLQGLVTAAQLDPDGVFTFRDADNVDRQLTAPEIIGMAMATMQHVQAQYVKSWTLKDQIDTATTAADLDAINW